MFFRKGHVQVGKIDHMSNTISYRSKSTRKGDTSSFMNISNALARRINKKCQGNDSEAADSHQAPDFSVSLCRLLSGVITHISSAVASAPFGCKLITKNPRFEFSQSFAPLLLTHILRVLEGQHVSYYLIIGYNGYGK